MENKSGGAKPAIRFGLSWADEVEREEREQQEQEERRRRETEREQAKADPFGAARPREVVLAEKGVDWRARDRELDLPLRAAPRPPRNHRHAASRGDVAAAPCSGATPARGAPRDQDAAGGGRTPHPRGRRAASSPSPPVSHSAWGGSKRKCAGEGRGPSRRVRQVGDQSQRRKVFGELNLGEGCGSSIRGSTNKGCDSGGSEAEVAVADRENGGRRVAATKVTATGVDGSAVAQKKKKGRKKRSGRRSKKTQNPQALLL